MALMYKRLRMENLDTWYMSTKLNFMYHVAIARQMSS